MATNKTLDGGLILMYVDSVAVAYSTSASLSLSAALRESAHKDDGGWTERAKGRFDLTGSCNVLLAFKNGSGSAIFNLSDIWTLIENGTEVTIKFSNSETGDKEWSGPAQMSGLNITFGNLGETAEGDFSFSAAGVWAQSTIAA